MQRFRLEPVAFMTDTQAMFYQVRVPEHEMSYLLFFWWEEGDLKCTFVDPEMRVDLSGAASFPSCSNYALRRTALKNTDCYGKDAAD